MREVRYAAHADSHIYSYYSSQLSLQYEARLTELGLSGCALAYRKIDGKCNIDFALEAFNSIRNYGSCTAVALDINSFFDKLNHVYLRQRLCDTISQDILPADLYAVFKSLTKHSWVERDAALSVLGISKRQHNSGLTRICDVSTFRTDIRGAGLVQKNLDPFGIPQGSPMSGLLSNIYMIDVDREMLAFSSSIGANYRRYSDDILLICKSVSDSAALQGHLSKILDEAGLTFNPAKTDQVTFPSPGLRVGRPLQYLGFLFDGIEIGIRSQTLARYYRRMKTLIRKSAGAANNRGASRIWRRRIYERYSHLGRRNFISYATRASKITGSKTVQRQAGRHWVRLQEALKQHN